MPGALSESKKQLLERLLHGGNPASNKLNEIPRRPEGVDIPMSHGQRQLWLHSQLAAGVQIYNDPVTIYRYGRLDRDALERTFTEIVRRHEAWRTTFSWKGSELVQSVQSPPEHIEIPYVDVSTIPADSREEAAKEIAMADVLAPFDLAAGPLYRPRLIRFSDTEHRLYLALHHIIFDGLSLYRIFLSELQVLYEAFSHKLASPLPPLPLQYGDYAIWQHGWVDEVSPSRLAYWRAKLEGTSHRDILKTDHPRSTTQSYRGDMVKIAFEPSLGAALEEVCQRLKVTPFMALLATLYILLWEHSNEEDLTIGTSSAGRHRPELEGLMGYFLDTVVLRSSLSGDPSFVEVLIRCRDELLESLANDGVPFSLMVKELSEGRDGSRHPFFQVMFSLEPPLPPMGPGWKFARMDIHNGSTKFDINVELDESPQGIYGRLIYNRDLFEKKSIERMVADWYSIVSRVVADPSRRISDAVADIKAREQDLPPDRTAVPEAATRNESNGILGSVRRLFSTK